MFINVSGSCNVHRYLSIYKHPAVKMVSLPGLWKWGMQLLWRVGNNFIFQCAQLSLGLQGWELRMRAVGAGNYTPIDAQHKIPSSTNTLLTSVFCPQTISQMPMYPWCHFAALRLRPIMAFVIWNILHCLQNWNPESIDPCKLSTQGKGIWCFCSMYAWDGYVLE